MFENTLLYYARARYTPARHHITSPLAKKARHFLSLARWNVATIIGLVVISLIGHGSQAASVTTIGTGNWSGATTSAWPLTNRTGTVTSSNVSTAITGASTLFLTELSVGNVISTQGGTAIGTVLSITDNTHLTLTANASNTVSAQTYRSNGVGSGDSVTIASAHVVTMDATNATVTALTLASAATANSLTIQTGKSLTVTGALTFTANAAANAQTITLQGTGTLATGSIVTSASTSTGASIITCASGAMGTLTVTGNIALVGSSVASSVGSKIDFGTTSTGCSLTAGSVTLTGGTVSAGLVKIGTGSFTLNGTLSGAGTAANAQFTTVGVSSVVLNGGTFGTGETLAIAAGTTLTSSGASSVTYATAVTTWGSLVVNSGTLTYSGAAGTFSNVTIALGSTLAASTRLITASGNFISSGTYSGSGGMTLTGSNTVIDGTGTYTNTGALTLISGNKTIDSTASMLIAGPIAISGAITITNNGIITLTSATGLTGTVVGSTWVNAANAIFNDAGPLLATGTLTATASNNLVTYNGAAQTVNPSTYNNLTVTGTGAKTMTGVTTVNGNFIANGGTETAPLTSIGGNFIVNGGTPTLSGALSVAGNLTVSSGTLTTGAANLTISGTTEVSGGSMTFTNNVGNKTMVGLVTVDGGTMGGASTSTFFNDGITQTSGNVSMTGLATFTTNSQALNGIFAITAVTVATGVTLTNNGNLTSTTMIDTGALINNSTITVSAGGSLTGAGSWTQGTNSVLTTGGATTNAMAVTTVDFTTNINTVTYSGAAQTLKPTAYSYLALSGSGAKTLTSVTTIDNDLTMSGTVTATPAANLTVGGALTVQAGTTLTTGNFTVNVTSATTVAGTFTHSGNAAISFSTLTVSGTLNGAGTGTMTATNDVIGAGTISLTGNTFEQRVPGNQNFGQTSGANTWAFKNLTFSNSSAAPARVATQTGNTGAMTVTALLTLGKVGDAPGATTALDPGGEVWTLSGTGTVFTLTSALGVLCDPVTCTDNTSVFKYTGATATAIGASTGYYEVLRAPTIAGAVTDTTPTGPITAYHRFTLNPTKAAAAACLTMNLGGDLNVPNGAVILMGTTFGCSVLNTTTAGHFSINADSVTIAQGPGAGATDNLIANGSLLTLTDAIAPLSIGSSLATYTYNTSTMVFTGSGATIPALSGSAGTNGYYSLTLSPSGPSDQVLGTAGGQAFQVNNLLIIGDSTNAGASAAANNPTITVLGGVTIAPNATLTATSNAFTVGGSWTDNGTFAASGSTVTFNGTIAGKTITSGGNSFANLVINSASAGAWTLQDALTVTSTMTLTKGTLDTGSNNPIVLGGAWAEAAGFNFNPNAGSVSLNGSSNQTIMSPGESFATFVDSNTSSGGLTFISSFTATSLIANGAAQGSALTLKFLAGSTATVTTLQLVGSSGLPVTLRSTTNGNSWYLKNTGSNVVSYVDAEDSNANSGVVIAPDSNSTNSGNNVHWAFVNCSNTFTSVANGGWSSGSTWDLLVPPSACNPVVIGPATSVTVDITTAGSTGLTINGTLSFSRVVNSTLTVAGGNITVNAGGIVDMGTSGSPITASSATFVLPYGASAGQYGLILNSGASFTSNGSAKTPFTTATAAGGGDITSLTTSITVASDAGWQNGDLITIDSEAARISALSGTTMTITPVAQLHSASNTIRVADLSRNVVVRSSGTNVTSNTSYIEGLDQAATSFVALNTEFAYVGGATGAPSDSVTMYGSAVISSSTFHNGYVGLLIPTGFSNSAATVTLSANMMYANANDGLQFTQASGANVISGNYSVGNGANGMDFQEGSAGDIIQNNKMYFNVQSGLVIENGAQTTSSNEIYRNGDRGILMGVSLPGSVLSNNQIHHNTTNNLDIFSETSPILVSSNTIWGGLSNGISLVGVSSITLTGTTVYGNAGYGVATNLSALALLNCFVYSNTQKGVVINNDYNGTLVSGCQIHDNIDSNVELDFSTMSATVSNNTVWNGGGAGIALFTYSGATVSSNTVYGNVNGISVSGGFGNTFTSNTITSNGSGFSVGNGTYANVLRNNWIYGNSFNSGLSIFSSTGTVMIGGTLGYDAAGNSSPDVYNEVSIGSYGTLLMYGVRLNPTTDIDPSGFNVPGNFIVSFNQSFATGTVRLSGDYTLSGSTLTLDYATTTYAGAPDANTQKILYFGPSASGFHGGRSRLTIDSSAGFHAVGTYANPTVVTLLPGGTYYTFVDSGPFTVQYASMTDMDESGVQLNGSGPFGISNSLFDYSGNGPLPASSLFTLNGVVNSSITVFGVTYGNSTPNSTNYNYTILGSSTGLHWANVAYTGALTGDANERSDPANHVTWNGGYCGTLTSVTNGPWSSAGTWDLHVIPSACSPVIIAGGTTVTVDVSNAAQSTTTINGTLSFSRTANSTMTVVGGNMVVNAGGTLDMGSSVSPINASSATLVLGYGKFAGQYGLYIQPGGNFGVYGDVTGAAKNVVVKSSGTSTALNTSFITNLVQNATSFSLNLGEFDGLGAALNVDANGIVFDHSIGTISSCTIQNGYDGIELFVSTGVTISNNLIQSNSANGIVLTNAANQNYISNNRLLSNTMAGIALNLANNNTISNNTLTSNSVHGLSLYASIGNTITGSSTSLNNSLGIIADGASTNNLFASNLEFGNFYGGLEFVAGSASNTVVLNTTYGNGSIGVGVDTCYGNVFANSVLGYNLSGSPFLDNDAEVSLAASGSPTILRAVRVNPAVGIDLTSFGETTSLISYGQDFSTGTLRVWGDYAVSGTTLTLDTAVQLFVSSATTPKLMRGTGHSLSSVVTNDATTLTEIVTVQNASGSTWNVTGSSSGLLGTVTCAAATSGCAFTSSKVNLTLNTGAVVNVGDSLDFATLSASQDAGVRKSLYFGVATTSFNSGRPRLRIDASGGFHAVGTALSPTVITELPTGGTYYTFADSGTFTVQYASFTFMNENGIWLNGTGPFSINHSTFDYSGFGLVSTSTLFTLNSVTQSTISLVDVTYGASVANKKNYNFTIAGSSAGLSWNNLLYSGGLVGSSNERSDPQAHITWAPVGCSTFTSIVNGAWSSTNTWDSAIVPTSCNPVVIATGTVVTVDLSGATASTTTVNGTLSFSRVTPSTFTLVGGNITVSAGGTLDMGTAGSPISGVSASLVLAAGKYKLLVAQGGVFSVYGPFKTSVLNASTTVATSATTLTLSGSATGWTPGDIMTIGATENNGAFVDQTERVTLVSTNSWPTISFSPATTYTHSITTAPVRVANLTRNVVVRSSGTSLASNAAYIDSFVTSATSFSLINGEFAFLGTSTQSGLILDGTGSTAFISSSSFHDGEDGVVGIGAAAVTIENSLFYRQAVNGIDLEGTDASHPTLNDIVRNNDIYSSAGEGLILYDAAQVVVSGNAVYSNGTVSTSNCGFDIEGDGGFYSGRFLTNQLFSNNKGFYVYMSSAGVYQSNRIVNNFNLGMDFDGNSSSNSITGDVYLNDGPYGLRLETGVSSNTFTNCFVAQNIEGVVSGGTYGNTFTNCAFGYTPGGASSPETSDEITLAGVPGTIVLYASRVNPFTGFLTSGFLSSGAYLLSYNQDFSTGTLRVYGDYKVANSTVTLDYASPLYPGSGDASIQKRLYFGPVDPTYNHGRSTLEITGTGGFHAVGVSTAPTIITALPVGGTYYTFVDSGAFTVQYASVTFMDETGVQLSGAGPFSINHSTFDYSGNGIVSTSTLLTLNGVTNSAITLVDVTYGKSVPNVKNYNYTIAGSSIGLQWINQNFSGVLTGDANERNDTANLISWTTASLYYWISPSASNWNNSSNWSATSGGSGGSGVPTPGSSVYFDGNGLGNCSIDTSVSVSTLTISTSSTGGYMGSVDTSSNSITLSTFTLNNGVFFARTSTITISGPLKLSSGTFNANASSITVSGPLTVSSATFNMGGSTVTSYGNVAFNTGAVVSAGSSLLNLVGVQSIIVAGPLTFWNVNVSSTVGDSTNGNIISVQSVLTVSGFLNVDAPPISMLNGSTATITSSGIVGSNGFTIFGSAVLGTGGTLSGTVRFNPVSTTPITIPQRAYGGGVIAQWGASATSSVVLASGNFSFPGGLQTRTFSTGNLTLDASVNNPNVSVSSVSFVAAAGVPAFNAGSGSWTIGGLNISTGVFNAQTSSLTIQSSVVISTGGAFNAGTSTVTFAPSSGSTATITGSATFYTLQDVTPNTWLLFQAGSTTTVTHALALSGSAGNYVFVRSTSTGVSSYLKSSGSNSVTFVDVQDNNASSGSAINANDGTSIDRGNNVNWNFGSARYWISPAASNWNNSANWSTVSGGSGGTAPPTVGQMAIFDRNGLGNCTIDVAVAISTLTISTSVAGGYSGTVDTSSNSIVLSTFTMNSGTFFARTSTVTVAGSLTINGGTFNANSSSMTISGDMYDNGALNRNASAETIGGNMVFGSSATNPDLGGTSSVILSGIGKTVTGGNYWNLTISSFTFSSGQNSFVMGTLNIVGTLQIPTFNMVAVGGSTVTVSGTIQSGTFILADNAVLGTGGTLTAQMNFQPLTMTATIPARTYGGAVVVYSSTPANTNAILGAGSGSFNGGLSIFTQGAGKLTLDATATNPAIATTSMTFVSSGNGQAVFNAGSGAVTFKNLLNLSTGTFNANTSSITIRGAMSVSTSSLFTPGTSTVTFSPASGSTSTLTGSASFYTLQEVTPNTTLLLQAGSTTTVTNTMVLTGSIGNFVSLRSTSTGTAAYLKDSGTNAVSFTRVQDNNASAGLTINANDGTSADLGNNTNWNFGSNRYWVSSVSSNWNNSANWSTVSGGPGGTAPPTVGQSAYFDANGLGNCVIDVAVNISTLTISTSSGSGYSGTVDTSSNSITLSTFTLNNGTFFARTSTITVAGPLTFSSGTFNGNGSSMTVSGDVIVSSAIVNAGNAKMTWGGNVTFAASAGFNPGTSSVLLTKNGMNFNQFEASGVFFWNLTTNANVNLLNFTRTDILSVLTVSPGSTLTISNANLYIDSGSTATILGTVSGSGALDVYSGAILGSGGTINTSVFFETNTGDVVLPARSYNGAVTVFNYLFGSGATRGVFAAGSHVYNGGLGLDSPGGLWNGNLTLDGSVNNPNVVVSTIRYQIDAGTGTLAINAGTGSWTVQTALQLSTGVFNANSSSVTIQGSLSVSSSAVFNAGTSTVTFVPAFGSTSTLTGSSTFYTLQDLAPNTWLQFQAGSTTTVTHLFNLAGSSGNDVFVRSMTPGTAAFLKNSGTSSVTFTNVQDNNASLGSTINASDGTSLDRGNNTNWNFGSSRYWISNVASNWNSSANWSTISGGPSGTSPPTAGQTAVFDANGLGNCTIDVAVIISTLTISTSTGAGYSGTVDTSSNSITLSTFTLNNGTFYARTSTISIVGPFTISSGTYNANGSTTTIGGDLVVTNGTFNRASSSFTIAGSATLTEPFDIPGTSIVTFTGTGKHLTDGNFWNMSVPGTLSSGGANVDVAGLLTVSGTLTLNSFNIIAHAGSTVTVSGLLAGGTYLYWDNAVLGTGGTITATSYFQPISMNSLIPARTFNGPVGALSFTSGKVLTAPGTVTFNGGLAVIPQSAGNLTLDASANNTNIVTTSLSYAPTSTGLAIVNAGSGTWSIANAVSLSTGTFNAGAAAITFSSSVALSGTHVFNAQSSSITVLGNWNNAATFNAGVSTVTFAGVAGSTDTLTGSTSFYSLTDASPGHYLDLTAGSTTTVINALTLAGSSTNRVFIRSTTNGTQAYLSALGTNAVTFVDVRDNNASGGVTINANDGASFDRGNTTNWNFGTNRYWISNVASNWNSSANWSTVSGGTGGTAPPTTGQAAIFDANGQGNCAIDVSVTVSTLTISTSTAGGYFGNVDSSSNSIVVSAFALSEGTFSARTSTVTVNGPLTISSGTFNANGSTITVNGDVTLSTATFNLGTSTVTVWGNFLVPASSAIFNRGTGLVTFPSSTTISINAPVSFYNLTTSSVTTINMGSIGNNVGVSNVWNIPSSAIVTLVGAGNNAFNVPGTVTLNGTLGGTASLVIQNSGVLGTGGTLNAQTQFVVSTAGNTTTAIPARVYGSNVVLWHHNSSGGTWTPVIQPGATVIAGGLILKLTGTDGPLVIDGATNSPTVTVNGVTSISNTASGSTTTLTMGGAWAFNNSVLISSGAWNAGSGSVTFASGIIISSPAVFNAQSSSITVSGAFTQTGFFNAGTSTVTFTGVSGSTSTLTGSTSFYTLQDLAPNTWLQFQGGATTTVTHLFNLAGTAGNYVFIRSTGTGVSAYLNDVGANTVTFTNVQDNNASLGLTINANDGTSVDRGNTVNWNFGSARYWISNSASNWNSSANWSTVSGGAGGTAPPTSGQSAIFDANGIGNCAIDIAVTVSTLTISTSTSGGYSGTVDTSSNAITVSSFTLNHGNFFARTSTMTLTGSLTMSSGTFNAGGSSITVSGDAMLSAGIFNGGTLSKMTIVGNFGMGQNLGYVPGTGTFTLSGAGKTADWSSTSFDLWNLSVPGSITTLSGQPGVLGSMNVSGSLTMNAYAYMQSGSTLTILSSGLIAGPAALTFHSGSSFVGASGTISAPVVFFGGIVPATIPARVYNGLVTISNNFSPTDQTLVLGGGTITFAGGVTFATPFTGNSIIDATTNNPNVIATDVMLTRSSSGNSIVNAGSGTWTMATLQLTTGTFNADSASLVISTGMVVTSGSIFAAGTSTVTFVGVAGSTDTLTGSTTFYSLAISSPGVSMTFPASSTTTVLGSLTITGSLGNSVFVRSSISGTQTYLSANGSSAVSYANVKDNNASGGNTINANDGTSVDRGNNVNWNFGSDRYWISSVASNWNNSANWSTVSGGPGGTAPPISGQTAIFNGNGLGNCAIDVSVAVSTLTISTSTSGGYFGAVDTSSNSISVSAFAMSNGTFYARTSTITVSGPMTVSSGTFDASTDVSSVTILGDLSIGTATFNTGSSTLTVSGNMAVAPLTQYNSGSGALLFNGTGKTELLGWLGLLKIYLNVTVSGSVTITQSGRTQVHGLTVPVSGHLTLGGTYGLYINDFGSVFLNGMLDAAGSSYLELENRATLGTGGTLNTPVVLQPLVFDITAPARVYGGPVTYQNISTTSHSVVMAAGNHAYNGGLIINAPTAGSVLADGASFNPNVYATSITYVTVGTGTLALNAGSGSWTVANLLSISTGTFNANTSSITIQGAMSISTSGVFNAGTSTVTFAPANGSTSTVTGSVPFYTLQDVTPNTALVFQSGSTTTVTGAFVLAGSQGNDVFLRSSVPGTQTYLTSFGSTAISFVNVKDNNASSGKNIQAGATSFDSGNNVNWSFGVSAPFFGAEF